VLYVGYQVIAKRVNVKFLPKQTDKTIIDGYIDYLISQITKLTEVGEVTRYIGIDIERNINNHNLCNSNFSCTSRFFCILHFH
jgi:hypothetical protein